MYVGGNSDGTFSGANGYIDGFSYQSTASPWDETCAVPTSDVPEPAAAVCLGLGGLSCLLRRRRC